MNHYADAKGPGIEAILACAGQANIRPARSTDAGAVAGLLGALGYPTDADAAAVQLEPLLDRDDTGVLVYVDDGEPVGLISYHVFDLIYRPHSQCRITALAVRADRRRQGVARALLEAVEAIARGRACSRIELTTRPDRDDALRFYEACGFAERPRRLVKPL